jgi:hypothetical protein
MHEDQDGSPTSAGFGFGNQLVRFKRGVAGSGHEIDSMEGTSKANANAKSSRPDIGNNTGAF